MRIAFLRAQEKQTFLFLDHVDRDDVYVVC